MDLENQFRAAMVASYVLPWALSAAVTWSCGPRYSVMGGKRSRDCCRLDPNRCLHHLRVQPYRIVQSREVCPKADDSQGFCSYFIAEEVQEEWNNPFTVILQISPAQGAIGVTMSRSMVEIYTEKQQAFAFAVWNALKVRGVVMHVIREQDTLQVPD